LHVAHCARFVEDGKMKTKISLVLLCGVIAAASGCGRSNTSVAVGENGVLNSPDEVLLRELLDTTRAELAAKAVELEEQMQRHDKHRREGQLKFTLLPHARVPHMPAVWRQASYSEARNFSVPPYLKGDAKDTPLALHLARFGDGEAALKLVDKSEAARINEPALDRNYPLEWTRLVSLHLEHAQFLLASDNVEGAKLLVSLHRQLRGILPDKARSAALGQALLPRGLPMLREAAAAWKKGGRADLAQEAEWWLAKFAAPAWSWPLPTDRAGLLAALGGDVQAKTPGVAAADVLRALDVTTTPVPHVAAEAVWALFNGDKVAEVLVAYRPEASDHEEASQWVADLSRLEEGTPGLHAALAAGKPHSLGIVQVKFADAAVPTLARDFGPLSLDRTFENNRRLFAWRYSGTPLTVTDARFLAKLALPTGERAPAGAVLEEQGELVKEFRFDFASDNKTTLADVAAPFWQKLGAGKLSSDGGLALTWNDGRTRYDLRFPKVGTQPIALTVNDSSGRDAAKRLLAAKARDLADRKARLAAKQPMAMLPRFLETYILGAKRSDLERAFPASAARRDFDGGIMAVFTAAPKGRGDVVAREVFTRFNQDDELAEVRVRYFDVPGNRGGTFMKRLEALKAAYGPGESLPAPTVDYSDLPSRKLSVTHIGWRDDISCLTAWSDGNALELTLRDCPADHPDGVPLPAFAFLPFGPADLSLGMARSEVLKHGAVPADDALLVQLKSGPYDSVLVWFDGDKASRIAARLRLDPAAVGAPAKALPISWARDARTFGWPWRQDLIGTQPQSFTTFDARIRYRLYWIENAQGAHVMAEWKEAGRK
jgi:hypothetical protein